MKNEFDDDSGPTDDELNERYSVTEEGGKELLSWLRFNCQVEEMNLDKEDMGNSPYYLLMFMILWDYANIMGWDLS